ncbi:MAG: MMPL family transporter [Acidimicrobiales bacterium]
MRPNGEFSIPAPESSSGFEVLGEYFPGQGTGGQVGSIVFKAEQGVNDPEVVEAMSELFDEVDKIDGVSLTSPYTSVRCQPDQSVRRRCLRPAEPRRRHRPDRNPPSSAATSRHAPSIDGVQIEAGGAALGEFEPPESELIGLAFAIVVLILSFGSVRPWAGHRVALFGVGTGAGVIALVSNLTTMPDFAPTLGAMIGLGVGIDYALFIVTRYREGTRAGFSPEEATVRAGHRRRAVAFAGSPSWSRCSGCC